MKFIGPQNDTQIRKSLHYTLYNQLVAALQTSDKDLFVCLKPICDGQRANEVIEERKYMILVSVVQQINLGVSSGLTFNNAVAAVPDYCDCELPPCLCPEEAEAGSGSGSGG